MLKLREVWVRTVHLTIEEILLDDCSSEWYYTCKVETTVYKDRPEPENHYSGAAYTGEYKITKYIQHKDGVQGLTYTPEQASVEIPAVILGKIEHAVDKYIVDNEHEICRKANEDEIGDYEYAQEQKFQAMRDGD